MLYADKLLLELGIHNTEENLIRLNKDTDAIMQ